MDRYKLFSKYFELGSKSYNKRRKIKAQLLNGPTQLILKTLEDKVNPYQGKNLKNRLNYLLKAEFEEFRDSLLRPFHFYVPEVEYDKLLESDVDSKKLRIIRFLPQKLIKGQHSKEYAFQLSKIIERAYIDGIDKSKITYENQSKIPSHKDPLFLQNMGKNH